MIDIQHKPEFLITLFVKDTTEEYRESWSYNAVEAPKANEIISFVATDSDLTTCHREYLVLSRKWVIKRTQSRIAVGWTDYVHCHLFVEEL